MHYVQLSFMCLELNIVFIRYQPPKTCRYIQNLLLPRCILHWWINFLISLRRIVLRYEENIQKVPVEMSKI